MPSRQEGGCFSISRDLDKNHEQKELIEEAQKNHKEAIEIFNREKDKEFETNKECNEKIAKMLSVQNSIETIIRRDLDGKSYIRVEGNDAVITTQSSLDEHPALKKANDEFKIAKFHRDVAHLRCNVARNMSILRQKECYNLNPRKEDYNSFAGDSDYVNIAQQLANELLQMPEKGNQVGIDPAICDLVHQENQSFLEELGLKFSE